MRVVTQVFKTNYMLTNLHIMQSCNMIFTRVQSHEQPLVLSLKQSAFSESRCSYVKNTSRLYSCMQSLQIVENHRTMSVSQNSYLPTVPEYENLLLGLQKRNNY